MRIVHLSDTHLGYGGHGAQASVEDPARPGVMIRQQEADVMGGLAHAVDRIVDAIRPEAVIHSGDLFEGSLPTPFALDFALSQFHRLADAGIPMILVEGDQSCPRNRAQGHVLHLLRYVPGVQVICADAGQARVGGLLVHAYPHRAIARGQVPDLAVLDAGVRNVLVAHGVADGLPFFRTHRLAAPVAVRCSADRFNYVALGHYHHFCQVPGTDRAFYAGSTAAAAPGDFRPGYQFGFNVVDLEDGCPRVRRELVPTRPMRAYGLDDARGLSAVEILQFLSRQAEAAPAAGAICRVAVNDLDPLVRGQLPIRQVEEIFRAAAVLSVTLRVREQRWTAVQEGLASGDPHSRFAQLLAQSDGDAEFKAEVGSLGESLLVRAAEYVAAEDLAAVVREEAKAG